MMANKKTRVASVVSKTLYDELVRRFDKMNEYYDETEETKKNLKKFLGLDRLESKVSDLEDEVNNLNNNDDRDFTMSDVEEKINDAIDDISVEISR